MVKLASALHVAFTRLFAITSSLTTTSTRAASRSLPSGATGIRRSLASRKAVIAEAGDGMQAVETIPRVKPDVVLLDLGLPGIDGRETARITAGISGVPEFPRAWIIETARHKAIDRIRRRVLFEENANVPLPIGFDKTVSQPSIVAVMTDLLDPRVSAG